MSERESSFFAKLKQPRRGDVLAHRHDRESNDDAD
jgi:hypothetical protein